MIAPVPSAHLMASSRSVGTLFVVATPIGNLDDITLRALQVLRDVDCIAAEDTRHTRKLLAAHAIATPVVSYHRHRERRQAGRLIERLLAGESIALVADAGTPAINDPGAVLVAEARRAGIAVVPVPGASALACALSVAAFQGQDVHFCGFLPARSRQRRTFLAARRHLTGLLVFFEAPHRIRESLADCLAVFGDCHAVLCRELTKLHEQVVDGRLARIVQRFTDGEIPARGEFVVMLEVTAAEPDDEEIAAELAGLLAEPGTSLRDAVSMVAERYRLSRSRVYRLALALRDSDGR